MPVVHSPWPLEKIQGFLMRGYRQTFVRYFAMSVKDKGKARRFLAGIVTGDASQPQVTTAEPWLPKPAWCLNVGFTFRGLTNLGLPQSVLGDFATNVDNGAFAQGSASRAGIPPQGIGDVLGSDPKNWVISDQDFDVLLMLFALTEADLEEMSAKLRALFAAGFDCPSAPGSYRQFDSQMLDDGNVYFGFKDGIAQPSIAGSPFSREPDGKQTPVDPGAILLGQATGPYYQSVVAPEPPVLGNYGCFGAFRILRQDVDGFEAQIESLAPAFGQKFGITKPEVQQAALRAKICGRWPNGTPLMLFPINGDNMPPALPPQQINNFEYKSDMGAVCPIGAHIRRGNPRDTDPNNLPGQPAVNHRVLRRAMAYQIPYDPNNRNSGERGLLGLFLGASFLKQFEFVMSNWINNPAGFDIETDSADPLMGTNSLADVNNGYTFAETIPTATDALNFVAPMSSFVFTKGSAYCYFPGIDGIRWIAQQTG